MMSNGQGYNGTAHHGSQHPVPWAARLGAARVSCATQADTARPPQQLTDTSFQKRPFTNTPPQNKMVI